MNRLTVLLILTVVLGSAGLRNLAHSDEPLDPRIAAYDKGPATIDVSKYPADMQAAYKLFTKKCSHCHTIARPINCDFALPDEWERYVKRMMRKPDSGISSDEAKQIFNFLVFDSKTRKKEMYEKKMKEQGQTPQQ